MGRKTITLSQMTHLIGPPRLRLFPLERLLLSCMLGDLPADKEYCLRAACCRWWTKVRHRCKGYRLVFRMQHICSEPVLSLSGTSFLSTTGSFKIPLVAFNINSLEWTFIWREEGQSVLELHHVSVWFRHRKTFKTFGSSLIRWSQTRSVWTT